MSVKAKYIKDLPLKNELDGSESLLVQDLNGTQQAPLGTIVDEIKQNSQEKIREIETELDVQSKRIDKIISLPEGSTTGDAELIDGRVGDDCVVYQTIGSAIRTQFSNIKKDLYEVSIGENAIEFDYHANCGISGTDEVDKKYTKALIESGEKGVAVISVKAGERYRISGEAMRGNYACLGFIFTSDDWKFDIYNNDNRINVVNGDFDCFADVQNDNAWHRFTDYEVVVPNGANFLYIRGTRDSIRIKAIVQNTISKIPTKNSQLKNDTGYLTTTDIENELYNTSFHDIVLNENTDYIYNPSYGISGTDGYTKALLELANNDKNGVAIIEVKSGEIYKVSGDTIYGYYNSLGLIFSDELWDFDSYTNNNRISIISGDYDYHCGLTEQAWERFIDYEVVVPNNARYMYVRGVHPIIKKCGKTLVSKIPTKISQLANDENFIAEKYKYFNNFSESHTGGLVEEDKNKTKRSDASMKWSITENVNCSITFNDINMKCDRNDTVGIWVYFNKAVTDRHTRREDGNTIEGGFEIKFNNGEFSTGGILPGYKYHNGWNYISFKPNLTEINSVSMTFNRVHADYTVIFDSIELNYKERTKVMLSFDNNQANLYNTIYPMLKERGFVGTYCLPSQILDNNGGTGVTLDNHRELMRNGWDYAYYASGDLRPSLSSGTDKEWFEFLENWKKSYEKIGIGVPVCYFSPSNQSDKRLIEVEKKVGFKMNRSMIAMGSHLIDTWDKDTFETTCIGVSTAEGSSLAKDELDKAIAEGNHLCIFIHAVTESPVADDRLNVSKDVYGEVLDYLKMKVDNNECDVITFREFYQLHEPSDYANFMHIRHEIENQYLLSQLSK